MRSDDRYKYEKGIDAIRQIKEAGYEAYLVGGCVRDFIMKKTEKSDGGDSSRSMLDNGVVSSINANDHETYGMDIDIATSATPKQVKAVFSHLSVIETGIKHGTVTVLFSSEKIINGESDKARTRDEFIPVEITTYRTESGYSDGRHPDSVAFTRSLEEDLKRRDFTVNAMAMDERGVIVDMFGGMDDISKGVIRAVGDPDERFREDALRIMRAIRFASVLGFEIEQETEAALFRNKELLKHISAERIFIELKKLVAGKKAPQVIRKYVDVIGVIIPELLAMKGFEQHNEYHRYDVLEHCIRAMEAVRTTPENKTYMKLAGLLHDVGKPQTYSEEDCGRGHFYGHAAKSEELVRGIMKRFKADKAMTDRLCILVKYHDLIFKKDEKLLKRWMRRYTPEVLFELLNIKYADNLATGNMSDELKQRFHEIEAMMKDIVKSESCFSLQDLAVDGNDIMALGVAWGPEIGRILENLLNAVIDGDVANEKESLLELAVKNK